MSKIKKLINESANVARTRNYATIVFEESAPTQWIEILKNQMVPAIVSPLHNRDVNPDGEPKKPHWHVIVLFDSVKTKKQAKQLFDLIGGVGLEVVQSIRGYARYLCHLDSVEKAQYSPVDVLCFCGVDYYNIIHLVTDRHKTLREIRRFCRDENVYSYSDLVDFCDENRPDWVTILDDNTIGIMGYLKSRYWTAYEAER